MHTPASLMKWFCIRVCVGVWAAECGRHWCRTGEFHLASMWPGSTHPSRALAVCGLGRSKAVNLHSPHWQFVFHTFNYFTLHTHTPIHTFEGMSWYYGRWRFAWSGRLWRARAEHSKSITHVVTMSRYCSCCYSLRYCVWNRPANT